MNKRKACEILGVSPDILRDELKRKYRVLMNLTHPDTQSNGSFSDYPFDAYEINEAYEYLLSNLDSNIKKAKNRSKKNVKWNAPINPNAFCEREIYQYYEDIDGNRIGTVTIDIGKYTWIPDEDFSLFLKSLYNVAKRIVSEDDEIKSLNRVEDMTLMSDIAYLLSGQFFGIETALSLMKKENDTYYTKALLEGRNIKVLPKIGDPVIPIKVTNHRLYVGDRFGNTLGYLSFNDDRLLFGLIPLFEQKEVLLKMEVESILKGHNPAIALWVKRIPSAPSTNIDSINLKIRKVLDSSY